jgi:hypothetical protein
MEILVLMSVGLLVALGFVVALDTYLQFNCGGEIERVRDIFAQISELLHTIKQTVRG